MDMIACEALLFDLDGVLMDSTACVERQWRRWAAVHGVDVTALLAIVHGRRTADVIRTFAPHLHAEEEADELDRREAADGADVTAMAGAAELLATLPPARWAIVTSCPRYLAEARLRRTGLTVPGVLICAEDVRQGKPHPQGYLQAAAHLGISPGDCVVVEDAPAGIEAARVAGMRVIAVATTHPVDQLAAADVRLAGVAALDVTHANPSGLSVRYAPGSVVTMP